MQPNKPIIEIDPENLKLSQDFTQEMTVERIQGTIEVRKPDPQWFVRTHPDPEMQLNTSVLILKEEREIYLVDPSVRDEICSELVPIKLVRAINRMNKEFLWPLRLPGSDGRTNSWYSSALTAAEIAINHWVRMIAEKSEYRIERARSQKAIPDPDWSSKDFKEILNIAFKDRYITDSSHPVVKKLRWEE